MNRRRLLSGLAGSAFFLSGCNDFIDSNGTDTPSTASPTANGTENGTETATASVSTETPTDRDRQWETYTNNEYGYRVQYPARWYVDEQTTETIFSPDQGAIGFETRVKSPKDSEITLDEIVEGALSSTHSRMDDVEVLDDQEVTLESGERAHTIQFRYDNPNDGGGMLRTTYLVTVSDGLVYELEFVTESTEYTETEQELAAAVIGSYALTGQQPEREQPTETEENEESDGDDALDLSSQDTYTNDGYGYSIDYPSHWTVYESETNVVEISNADGDIIRVFMEDISEESYSMEETADEIIESTESGASESSLSKEGQTTIESGHSALMIHGTYDLTADEAEMLRSTILVTASENASYVVKFIADAVDWSPTVRNDVNDILTSLTISDSPTDTPTEESGGSGIPL